MTLRTGKADESVLDRSVYKRLMKAGISGREPFSDEAGMGGRIPQPLAERCAQLWDSLLLTILG